uniref:Putative potassium channel regulatory protein unc-93 n=1 Tax=Anisakis simplex TaxID=6269 RepID=A0A346RVM7_ANISI|nr:putative potassium channel regulatory protein unc-93 [Anisakis simplex]
MDRGNAWDLVQETPKTQRQKSQSPSCRSRKSEKQLIDLDVDTVEIPPEELSMIIDEEVRRESERRTRRSRSPAVESLRKVSRIVLQKVGIRQKRHSQVHDTSPRGEIPWIELGLLCTKPITYIYERKVEPFVSPRRPLSAHSSFSSFRDRFPVEEKCAYLFRGDSLQEPLATVPEELDRVHVYDPYCPVHGSRRRLTRRRPIRDLGSFQVTTIDSVEINEPTSEILISQAYAAKIIRKRRRATRSRLEKIRFEKAKCKIRMNLWVISVAFLFLFTAFHGLQNLQTSLNGQLGADSLGVFYISLAISAPCVPPFMLNRLGCKLTVATSAGCYMIYMIANFLPKYYSLLPAAVLAGCAGSCLWAANCVYILESGLRYAQINVEAQNVVVVRFFGYFFMILHLGQVIGNLLSSFILTTVTGYQKPADRVETSCGHLYRENVTLLSERAAENLRRPPQSAYLAVCGVYFCCTIVALMIILMFLNSLRKDKLARQKAPYFSTDVLKVTLYNITHPRQIMLIPLTIFNGIEQAFVVGLYTKAYVGCGLGISQIGFVMTSFGVADAICSLVFGPLMKLFGRMPLFVFGAVINMLMIMTLMIWPLNPGDTALFYAIAGVWGMADGVWNTQINGLWVVLSNGNLEGAFANYRVWESFGFAIGLLLTRYTTIAQFLVFSFTILLIGISGYAGVEFYDQLAVYFKSMYGVCLADIINTRNDNIDSNIYNKTSNGDHSNHDSDSKSNNYCKV